jgi:hypothetical protein
MDAAAMPQLWHTRLARGLACFRSLRPRKIWLSPSELEKNFSNNKIQVIELAWLSDQELELLTGDLRNLATHRTKTHRRIPKNRLSHRTLNEFIDILATITNDCSFEKLLDTELEEENDMTITAYLDKCQKMYEEEHRKNELLIQELQ